ncbi:MAG TPA: amidase, partial [Rikenellaceae bacterium]|nr:amidase [Rikenellaceae bacterium]
EGEICDARFSKCCGGRMELFSTCWEDKDYPYLQALPDTPDCQEGGDVFCDTKDEKILSQVLNDYDLETKDFYRWRTEYSRAEVSDLIHRRSGIDFGTVRDLVPIERGPSGRLKRLKVIGDKKSMVIGKELIIRRWLSDSHLKSSAFDVKWIGDQLILDGAGWGHGVGLCQIGAAVMASRGYSYDQILFHYYPGSKLERR